MITRFRWLICVLLFFATTINYMDRQILSLLKPILDKEIGWTNEQFGTVNAIFQGFYGLGLIGFGFLIDRFGVKSCYALSITGWSLAAAAHAVVSTLFGFQVARAILGQHRRPAGRSGAQCANPRPHPRRTLGQARRPHRRPDLPQLVSV